MKDFSDQSLQKYLFPYTPYLTEYYEKLLKTINDPRHQYTTILLILKSDNTFDNQKQETFKQLLVNLEREILKEHPGLKNTIKKSKEELFEKYPHWRKDLSQQDQFEVSSKTVKIPKT